MLTCLLPNRSWQHQSQSPAAFLLKRAPSEGVHVHVQDETTLMTRHHYHYHYHYHHHQVKTMRRPCGCSHWVPRTANQPPGQDEITQDESELTRTRTRTLVFCGNGQMGKKCLRKKEMAASWKGGGKTTIPEFSIAGARIIRVRVRDSRRGRRAQVLLRF